VTSPWPGRRSSTRRAWRPSAEATARSDVITARSLAESSLDAYRAYACFPCSLPCSPTPLACPRVCVVFGYRTLCTLRSSVRSTVPWRHVGPKPATSRSSEPVTSCAWPGSDLSADGWATPEGPARRAYLRQRIREGSRRANLRMPPRTRRRLIVDPADKVCDKVVTDQIAAYAPVRANGHRQARLYAHTLRGIASVPTITSHQRRDVRSVCCVLVARCGKGAGPGGDSYAIRTRRLLGWHRAADSRRAAPHGHGPNPCRPAAADCPRGSPDAERQRADGLAPGRRRHSSRRAHPRVGADQ
jgi:hypothetical protein